GSRRRRCSVRTWNGSLPGWRSGPGSRCSTSSGTGSPRTSHRSRLRASWRWNVVNRGHHPVRRPRHRRHSSRLRLPPKKPVSLRLSGRTNTRTRMGSRVAGSPRPATRTLRLQGTPTEAPTETRTDVRVPRPVRRTKDHRTTVRHPGGLPRPVPMFLVARVRRGPRNPARKRDRTPGRMQRVSSTTRTTVPMTTRTVTINGEQAASHGATRPARSELLPQPSRCAVLGVLNVTPDSFSDGGRYHDIDDALTHAREMWQRGADLIDVGGESTRPGASRVATETENERVLPVVRSLAADGVRLAVDTTRARVAEAALEAGASVVNDVSGGLADPDMAS